MKRSTNLLDLLIENLKKFYSAEQQQLAALPKLVMKANDPMLTQDLTSYIRTKEKNINRIKDSLQALNVVPRPQQCDVIHSMLENCQASFDHAAEEDVADAALIATIQQINHFNIANYGTAASYARTLGHTEIIKLLADALKEEREADTHLSRIAEKTINPAAAVA